MRKIYLLFVVLCFFSRADLHAQKKTEFVSEFKWILGTWEIKTDAGNMTERWIKVDKNTYSAVVNFLQNPKDNIELDPLEKITLTLKNDTVYFISQVSGQNNDLPVEFIYSGVVDGWYLFENPTHDFPQIISYKPIDKKSLNTKISGTENGENKVIEFNYTKK